MSAVVTRRIPETSTTTVPSPSLNKQLPSDSASFWEDIHRIRTNGFDFSDSTLEDRKSRKWSFQSRKSHILDTKGHYAWERELNCYQLQKLPAEVFPDNTLEIRMNIAPNNNANNDSANSMNDESSCQFRIRFGALEGLRGWVSLDAPPIPTTHALDSAHWKYVAAQGQLPSHKSMKMGSSHENIFSTSYDYAFTTLYKGGTDVVIPTEDGMHNYHYLHPNSTSFVPKHNADQNDVPKVVRGASGVQRVKVRRPICKCKSDGGRAPLVPQKGSQKAPSSEPSTQSRPPAPQWTNDDSYKVDIEGMLRRASAGAVNKQRPFLFREDVDLWEDDLHDNGVAWLKARCFVCSEGWACLLRNFIRVDGVLCRVIDARYIHTFGTNKIYREQSWREGPWEPLVRAIQRDGLVGGPAGASRMPSPSMRRPMPMQPVGAINDSIATRYLPLKGPPRTESLSLDAMTQEIYKDGQQLFVVHDKTIDDAIPVPNSHIKDTLGISFVLKRSRGTVLEAISSLQPANETDSPSLPVSTLWSKEYDSDSTILSTRISPNPSDGGRLAIGDDRGKVNVWRLSTGESLWEIPVAPSSILKRLETNPFFESARLWVDHLAWNIDGSLLGASAGRNAVMASCEEPSENCRVLASLECTSGTVTGLTFCRRPNAEFALAVAAYGEIQWVTPQTKLQSLKREGAAIECIDISPDGSRIAVGFLDKTLRIFNVEESQAKKENRVMDWVGFATAVKSVQFNATGQWLAAMGGNAILVIRDSLSPRTEPPMVCRTPGHTGADGADGTCNKFLGMQWSGGDNEDALLAALDANTNSIHVFRFSKQGPSNISQNTWPTQVLPVRTVPLSFENPSPLAATRFEFFSDTMNASGFSLLSLEKSGSTLEKAFGAKLVVGISDTSSETKKEDFCFRRILY